MPFHFDRGFPDLRRSSGQRQLLGDASGLDRKGLIAQAWSQISSHEKPN